MAPYSRERSLEQVRARQGQCGLVMIRSRFASWLVCWLLLCGLRVSVCGRCGLVVSLSQSISLYLYLYLYLSNRVYLY